MKTVPLKLHDVIIWSALPSAIVISDFENLRYDNRWWQGGPYANHVKAKLLKFSLRPTQAKIQTWFKMKIPPDAEIESLKSQRLYVSYLAY